MSVPGSEVEQGGVRVALEHPAEALFGPVEVFQVIVGQRQVIKCVDVRGIACQGSFEQVRAFTQAVDIQKGNSQGSLNSMVARLERRRFSKRPKGFFIPSSSLVRQSQVVSHVRDIWKELIHFLESPRGVHEPALRKEAQSLLIPAVSLACSKLPLFRAGQRFFRSPLLGTQERGRNDQAVKPE